MIKPGQIKPRTDWKPSKKGMMKPFIDIELEWIHGYKA